jgi:hypothetical protein
MFSPAKALQILRTSRLPIQWLSGIKEFGIELITLLHLVERLKITEDISQLPHMLAGPEQESYYCHFPFYRQNLRVHSLSLMPAISVE